MMKTTGNTEHDERGLLPYPVIIAATKGDPQAMSIVVQHYESYIASLSMRKLRDERGNTYYGIDEDIYREVLTVFAKANLIYEDGEHHNRLSARSADPLPTCGSKGIPTDGAYPRPWHRAEQIVSQLQDLRKPRQISAQHG